ncbi:hypothetical protein LG296_08275 [Ureibacillus chungkukjangi]|uniref:hypothetical protein n=1 Tax=Ureibacillus chungkukjangi TaxID=1202712 RepID=UPI00384C6A53
MKARFLMNILTTILLMLFVFMNYLEIWTANLVVQAIFFIAMVSAIFNVGIEYGKRAQRNK